MNVTSLRVDRPMPDIARACVDSLHEGQEVELRVAKWRRPGLTRAIMAEQQVRGLGSGRWRFVDPDTEEAEPVPDVEDVLGWSDVVPSQAGETRRSRRTASGAPQWAPAPGGTIPMPPEPSYSPVTPLWTDTQATEPPLPVAPRRVHVNGAAAHPPVLPTPAAPPPLPSPVVHAGQSLPKSGAMLAAAYTVVACSQQVMAAGLRPSMIGRHAAGPAVEPRRWSAAQALAELEELDGL